MTKMGSASVVSGDTNYVHKVRAGHFDLIADEPKALGGQGQGPAPFDYYLAALSACTAITLRMYAERKGWNLGEFRAELALSRDEEGRLHVHRVLHSDQALSDAQWERLLEVVVNTPVTKALREGAEITSERGR
ncbi:putative redox protein, regulator of disulfide bond formation [Acidovorax sp. CF316]|uniref:OsmC family protein n=1 Tax=Acidovorax sp. CF316 TaxID=1144317 RepID=UPI00026BCBCC|nr:OsmC family protein [Acidovorax sp. CF316]EJE50717.1 putative redox protein, regulator of disulfide bond formation [Acidovorax sp. CF316]